MSKYLRVDDGKTFYNQIVNPESKETKKTDASMHHTFIIDCSGSMYSDLPKIRRDLYNKISTMLKPNDSITIIWFSGRGQFGVLLEDYRINGPISLNKVKYQINKYLVTVGLTAFKEPIEELKDVINRTRERNPDMLHTMFFLTDGHDNCWSNSEIIKSLENVKEELAGATIVEYGWYCNKNLLNEMATTIGGVHTFSENFDDYEEYANKTFKNTHSVKRRYVKLDHAPYNGVVFNIVDGDVITYSPNENNEVFVGVDGEINLFYFTESNSLVNGTDLGGKNFISSSVLTGVFSDSIFKGLYGAAFAYSRISDYNMVSEILKMLGDAYLIKEKSNTFGTQKINELESKFINAINDESKRFIDGYNPNLEPAEDAFCVIDMIEELMSSPENVWYPRHDSFSYEKTGSKTVSKNKELSQENKDEIKSIIESGNISDIKNKIQEIEDNTPEDLKFHYNDEMPSSPFLDLTWNEKRANLSVRVQYQGYVELPSNEFNIGPKFETSIWRNYTIIKDGIIHTYKLPVSLNESTFKIFKSNGLFENETWEEGKIMILDFSELPVINRKMVKTLSAKDLFNKTHELIKLKASNYVFNQYKKRLFEGVSKGFVDIYGKEATKWLETLGLKDYGFNPPSKVEKTNEEIEVNTLEVKIKGLTSNPTKKDFDGLLTKLEAGLDKSSFSTKELLIYPAVNEFRTFVKSLDGLVEDAKNKIIEEWLYSKSESFRDTKAKLMTDISKAKFLTIVGRSWFQEFSNREENELTLPFDGNDISCTVIDKQETIKI